MKKKIMAMLFVVATMCSFVVPAFATTDYGVETGDVLCTVTNDETGEVKNLEIQRISTSKQMSSFGTEVTANYEAFAEIPTHQNRSTEDKGKTEGGVTIRFSVVYTISANKEDIKVSRIYGNWTPSANFYIVTNRTVGIHAGLDGPSPLVRHPSTNSFDYSTGWGYNGFVVGANGSPFAWADAVILVSGMSGSHTLNCGMSFPDER